MMDKDQDFEIFRDMTIKVLNAEVEPYYDQWEEEEETPRGLWNILGAAGLLGVDIPVEYGGAGASLEIGQMIISEMARMCFGGLATGYSVHSNIVMQYILKYGTDEQKQLWLPKMCSGEVVGAIAMTEPGAGSDLGSIRTRAVPSNGKWIINGSKTFITNGAHADVVIICAKTDNNAGAKGMSLFLVDASLPGLVKGKKIKKIGLHSSDTAELFFEDLEVDENCLLGTLDHGFFQLMDELPRERLGLAMQALGACDGALEITTNYVHERKAFGISIDKFQNTRFKLAELVAQIEVCRSYMDKCLTRFKLGIMTTEEAAILKLTITETQMNVMHECLQLFGGYGYTVEYPISRFFKDARVQTIYGGTSEIMKEVIARKVLGR